MLRVEKFAAAAGRNSSCSAVNAGRNFGFLEIAAGPSLTDMLVVRKKLGFARKSRSAEIARTPKSPALNPRPERELLRCRPNHILHDPRPRQYSTTSVRGRRSPISTQTILFGGGRPGSMLRGRVTRSKTGADRRS